MSRNQQENEKWRRAKLLIALVVVAVLGSGVALVASSAVMLAGFRSTTSSLEVLPHLEAIAHAQREHLARFERYGTLTELRANQLIGDVWADGAVVEGYRFRVELREGGYALYADAESFNPFSRNLYMDESGIIRARDGESAGPADLLYPPTSGG